MGSITAVNSSFTIAVTGLFAVPQPLIGYDVDDAFATEPVDVAETKIGVDGLLSAGLVWTPIAMDVVLQADSPSLSLFEAWYAAMVANGDVYFCFGAVRHQSLRRSYALSNGVLKNYTPMSSAKRVLQPRRFQIHWQPPIIGVPF